MLRIISDLVGNTPLVKLKRLPGETNNLVLAKLEGNNPTGSAKDRAAFSMVTRAQDRGYITPGDTLIEATSGNIGIALAMVAAVMGYRVILVMPEHLSIERRQSIEAYGAEIILTSVEGGMEEARDEARRMESKGYGVVLDQYANPDNPLAHYESTGPEIWSDTNGEITHFVSCMGTTGTIMGCGQYLKEMNSQIQIIGVQPEKGTQIPGISKWSGVYIPEVYNPERVNRIFLVSQPEAEKYTRLLASAEGIFAGISSGGALAATLKLSAEVRHAVIVFIACDRGDRYLSTGVFTL